MGGTSIRFSIPRQSRLLVTQKYRARMLSFLILTCSTRSIIIFLDRANLRTTFRCLLACMAGFWLVQVASAQSAPDSAWPNYGNDPGGARYSSARQIDRTNVNRLQLAWTYHTGAMLQETKLSRKAAFEATPILVDNKLFLNSTSSSRPGGTANSAQNRATMFSPSLCPKDKHGKS